MTQQVETRRFTLKGLVQGIPFGIGERLVLATAVIFPMRMTIMRFEGMDPRTRNVTIDGSWGNLGSALWRGRHASLTVDDRSGNTVHGYEALNP